MLWTQTSFVWLGELFDPKVMDEKRNRGRADLWYGYIIQDREIGVDWLQDLHPGKAHSYKIDLKTGDPFSFTRIVCFHGEPLPHEVENDWVEEHWK